MDYIEMMEQIEGKVEDPTVPMPSQKFSEWVSELLKGLRQRLMRQFFEELELEGREPLSQEALCRFFDIFSQVGHEEGLWSTLDRY